MTSRQPEATVKRAPAIAWTDIGGREAPLQRRAAGDEAACAELVDRHQRMVFHLALHLLGTRTRPWTCLRTCS
jgi:hypothetical protein